MSKQEKKAMLSAMKDIKASGEYTVVYAPK